MEPEHPSPEDPRQPVGVFVYGTLQRGQKRAPLWPRPPLEVLPATTQGRLFDLVPYPALLPGEGPVAGELWCFRAVDLEATLEVLDAIEGHAGTADDLYVRRLIECQCSDGRVRRAYAYFFNRPGRLMAARPIEPGSHGAARWPT